MANSSILVAACILLTFGTTCTGDEVIFQPAAPISHEWIVQVVARRQKDGLQIMIRASIDKERGFNRVLFYEDVAVSIIDDASTRSIPVAGRGAIPATQGVGMRSSVFVVKTDAKEIRAVLVRVKDLVVALTPSLQLDKAAAKIIAPEQREDKKGN